MKITLNKIILSLAVTSLIFTSCEKEGILDSQSDVMNAEVQNTCKLVSATKVSSNPVNEETEELMHKVISSDDLVSLSVLGKELVNFDIVTYRIQYHSETVCGGKPKDLILTGDVSFVVDRTGAVKNRHLESVTLFNTVFNTSKEDVAMVASIIRMRAIYNALVVFPLYQGGPDSDDIFAAPCEHIIKAKQALDCELAALEFIESLPYVEMLPDYYTENIGVSNGGGSALAVQYLLENDEDYSQYSRKINLRSTYVGSGNCSTVSLMDNMLKVDDDSNVASTASCGFIAAVAGAYYTWGDKYFEESDTTDYFSPVIYDNAEYKKYLEEKEVTLDSNWKQLVMEENKSVLDIYHFNLSSLYMNNEYYNPGCVPTVKTTINKGILSEDGEAFNMESVAVQELLDAFNQENEIITYGWKPKAPLKFAHSVDDDFILFEVNYGIWKELSNNGRNKYVKLYKISGLDHSGSTAQFIADILTNKHPYSAVSIISYEDILGLFS